MKIVNTQTHEDTELFNFLKTQAGALLSCKDLCPIGFAVWRMRQPEPERGSGTLSKLKIYVGEKKFCQYNTALITNLLLVLQNTGAPRNAEMLRGGIKAGADETLAITAGTGLRCPAP